MRTVKRLQIVHSSLLASSSASSACLLRKIDMSVRCCDNRCFSTMHPHGRHRPMLRFQNQDPLAIICVPSKISAPCGKIGKQTFMRSLASCRITVHTNHFCMREDVCSIYSCKRCVASSQGAPVSAVAARAGLRQYL